jgi:hypothetical protein
MVQGGELAGATAINEEEGAPGRWRKVNAAVLLHYAGETNEGEMRAGAGEGDCVVVLEEEGMRSV